MTSDTAGQLYCCGTQAALTAALSGLLLDFYGSGQLLDSEADVSLAPSALTTYFRRSWRAQPEIYGSPGWIGVMSRTGTSTTGTRQTAAPVGRAKPCSRPTWPGTVTFSQTASASVWRLLRHGYRQPIAYQTAGVRVTTGSHPATSGTRASSAKNEGLVAGEERPLCTSNLDSAPKPILPHLPARLLYAYVTEVMCV